MESKTLYYDDKIYDLSFQDYSLLPRICQRAAATTQGQKNNFQGFFILPQLFSDPGNVSVTALPLEG